MNTVSWQIVKLFADHEYFKMSWPEFNGLMDNCAALSETN
jgi:hypothetical protein